MQMNSTLLHSNENVQYKLTSYTNYRIGNDTTRTIPLGAKFCEHSVAIKKLRRLTSELRKETNKT